MTLSIAPTSVLARVKNPLPEGTLPVGLGLAISGICLYGFIAVASRALGLALYAPFATFWPVLFICGPGFFLPLEQEVGRALAARRARGLGSGPLVRRAAVTGIGVAGALAFGALAFFPVFGLTDRLFDGNTLLLYALAAGFAAYCAEHLARGTLSGNGRFRAYGVLLGVEGIVRVSLCVALWVLNVKDPGYYGVAMVAGSAVAILVASWGQHGLVDPGPDAPWSELSSALGYLLVTSVLTQLLLNVGPIAVKLLATPAEAASTGPFLNGLIIARVPLFLFQAVQAALLPKLAGYASTGRHADLRRALRRLLAFVLVVGAAATAGAFLLGPWVVRFLFGPGFDLGHADLGALALASAGYMVALVLTQALISLHGYWRALTGWSAGLAGFLLVTLSGQGLFSRVERGLVTSAAAAIAIMAVMLLPLLADRPEPDADQGVEEFSEAPLHL